MPDVRISDDTEVPEIATADQDSGLVTVARSANGAWRKFKMPKFLAYIKNKLRLGYAAVTTAYTVNKDNDESKVLDVTGSSDVTISLPNMSSTDVGYELTILRNGTGDVTIDPYSTQQVAGASTLVLSNASEVARIYWDGAEWLRINNPRVGDGDITEPKLDISNSPSATLNTLGWDNANSRMQWKAEASGGGANFYDHSTTYQTWSDFTSGGTTIAFALNDILMINIVTIEQSEERCVYTYLTQFSEFGQSTQASSKLSDVDGSNDMWLYRSGTTLKYNRRDSSSTTIRIVKLG